MEDSELNFNNARHLSAHSLIILLISSSIKLPVVSEYGLVRSESSRFSKEIKPISGDIPSLVTILAAMLDTFLKSSEAPLVTDSKCSSSEILPPRAIVIRSINWSTDNK
ncbi:hypothetical protein WICPIJ_008157 [Wickerhamomyces pijperi]|uniref:Uncharacterized protein n=1 Tax=Wickerhamomyces pijperi TaxID=599730 RepID=A0A9P8PYK2_WICPI|nr:hypothetical protein WICPIJ_008157 [Wickerhamomyces pijperi]